MKKISRTLIDKGFIFFFSICMPTVVSKVLSEYLHKINYNLLNTNGVEIIKTLVGIWGTLLGFIITAVSILITINGKKHVKAFKASGHYSTVLFTYLITSISLFAATVFSVVVICFNVWNWLVLNLMTYFLVATLSSLFFSLYFLFLMIYYCEK
jgi:hypothetical protein